MRRNGTLHPPRRGALRRKSDHLVLLSGSALVYKEGWQAMASRMPANAVLVVLPSHNKTQKGTLLSLAKSLAAAGHQVRVVPEAELARVSVSTEHSHGA
jgi:hypothetical protein